jgi:GNAT superfamily N-acetyltransferase
MNKSLEIVRVSGTLPDAIDVLEAAAAQEGVRNVGMLVAGWASGAQRFDRGGAALFAALHAGTLAGIGGVKPETEAGESAMRMHRFYVHPSYRRDGVGRALAGAVMTHALTYVRVLTCNARATPAAGPFWEAMGFARVESSGYTHLFRIQNK